MYSHRKNEYVLQFFCWKLCIIARLKIHDFQKIEFLFGLCKSIMYRNNFLTLKKNIIKRYLETNVDRKIIFVHQITSGSQSTIPQFVPLRKILKNWPFFFTGKIFRNWSPTSTFCNDLEFKIDILNLRRIHLLLFFMRFLSFFEQCRNINWPFLKLT